MFKITIIIPDHQINETFESLLSQSIGFENLQVIIVYLEYDKNIISYAEKYENVISMKINDSDNFYGELYNLGIKHAAGDYLMFLNTNDKINNDCCELLYNEILKEDNSCKIIDMYN